MKTMIQRVARGARSRGGPVTFLVLAVVTLFLPSLASATPVTVNFTDNVVLTVEGNAVAGGGWKYDYSLTNTGYAISRISVGFGSSVAGQDLGDVKILNGMWDIPNARTGFPRLSSTSLLWYFASSFTTGLYEFSITYDREMAEQYISIAGSPAITQTVSYPGVPEPATLLLVGAGMLALGTLMRRKKRS